ncbi:MAG TPA: Do family serine endopeptidase [Aestuariivirga sp.]
MRLVLTFVLGLGLFASPVVADTVAPTAVPQSRQDMRLSFAPLVKRTAPAVVNVYAKTIVRQEQQASPFDDPIFKHFFPQLQLGQPRERVANSLGSGVIVDKSGIIVTNNHVISGATDIRVALADKREFEAKVVLADEKTDLAILRISVNDENLPTLPLGDSDQMEVGDLVLAIGNPFGVGQTVTSGIVSALSRNDVGASDYQSFIQTDAAINPGNSGGALVNMKGQLVGINSMIYTRTGGSVGLGFAIPTNLVATVLQSAVSGQKLVRPWFGGTFQNVTPDIAEALGMSRPEGVLVNKLNELSPLAKAGIQAGDVILAMDGKSLENAQEFHYLLGLSHVGEQKLLEVQRNGAPHNYSVALIAAPETVARDEQILASPAALAGVTVDNLSPAVTSELDMDDSASGVVVSAVANGPAQQFFAKGDIIRTFNGVNIDNVQTLLKTAQQAGRGLTIMIERGAQKLYLRLG